MNRFTKALSAMLTVGLLGMGLPLTVFAEPGYTVAVETLEAEQVTANSAVLSGHMTLEVITDIPSLNVGVSLTAQGGEPQFYSADSTPDVDGAYRVTLPEDTLEPDTLYTYTAVVLDGAKNPLASGEERLFRTLEAGNDSQPASSEAEEFSSEPSSFGGSSAEESLGSSYPTMVSQEGSAVVSASVSPVVTGSSEMASLPVSSTVVSAVSQRTLSSDEPLPSTGDVTPIVGLSLLMLSSAGCLVLLRKK